MLDLGINGWVNAIFFVELTFKCAFCLMSEYGWYGVSAIPVSDFYCTSYSFALLVSVVENITLKVNFLIFQVLIFLKIQY